NLRWLDDDLQDRSLTLEQRDAMAQALETSAKKTFQQLRKLAGLGNVTFNIEDARRQELKGNATSCILSKKQYFGSGWAKFNAEFQDEIVVRLLTEENETALIAWLVEHAGIDEARAELIANVTLPDGYGRLSLKAIRKILPELRKEVCTYSKAVIASGIDHHSHLGARASGEILP